MPEVKAVSAVGQMISWCVSLNRLFVLLNGGFCRADRSCLMILPATADVPISIDKKPEFSFLCFRHADPDGLAQSSCRLPTLENTYTGGMKKIREVKRSIDIQCLAQHRWSPRQAVQLVCATPTLHCGQTP